MQQTDRRNSLEDMSNLGRDSIHRKWPRHRMFRCMDQCICYWCTIWSDCIQCLVCIRDDNRCMDRPNIPLCTCKWHCRISHWRRTVMVHMDCMWLVVHRVRLFQYIVWMDRRWNAVDTYSWGYDFERGILKNGNFRMRINRSFRRIWLEVYLNWSHRSLRMDLYIFRRCMLCLMHNLSSRHIPVDNLAVNRSSWANTNTTDCCRSDDILHIGRTVTEHMDLHVLSAFLRAQGLGSIERMDLRSYRLYSDKLDCDWSPGNLVNETVISIEFEVRIIFLIFAFNLNLPAEMPHVPVHGFVHLNLWQALFCGHSAFTVHSGLQFGGTPM